MSIPNRRGHDTIKFSEEGVVWYVKVADLSGLERAYLAQRGRLNTGKTAKNRSKKT
jgi:hypothetical protein